MSPQKITNIIIEKYLINWILDFDSLISSQSKKVKIQSLKKIGGSVNSVYSFTLLYNLNKQNKKLDLVLKLFNPSEKQRKICKREYGVLTYLKEKNFSVPLVYIMETDESFLGGPFMIMERIEGKSIADYLKYNKKKTNEIIRQLAKVLVLLHNIEIDNFQLSFLDLPENEYSYAKKTSLLKSELDYAKYWNYDWITNWLKMNVKNCPCKTYSLLHFDSNLKNFIVSKRATLFVVDWEWAEIGDAVRDVACAYHETSYALGPSKALLFLNYYKNFSERSFTPIKLDFYLVVSGLNLSLYNRLLSTRNMGTEYLIRLFGKKVSPLFPFLRWHFRRKYKSLEKNLRNIIAS